MTAGLRQTRYIHKPDTPGFWGRGLGDAVPLRIRLRHQYDGAAKGIDYTTKINDDCGTSHTREPASYPRLPG